VRYFLRALSHDPLSAETYLYLGLAAGGPLTFGAARRVKRRLAGAG